MEQELIYNPYLNCFVRRDYEIMYRDKSIGSITGDKLSINLSDMIEKVIFNDPATIVFWKDGTKTVTKCGELDIYDPEKGMAMCLAKYLLGNKGNYFNVFKKWIPEEVDIPEFDGPNLFATISERMEDAMKLGFYKEDKE